MNNFNGPCARCVPAGPSCKPCRTTGLSGNAREGD